MKSIQFFSPANEMLASYRYRVRMPVEELSQKGYNVHIAGCYKKPRDIAVFGKHYDSDIKIADLMRQQGAFIIYDVCDNHFGTKLDAHYSAMISIADRIICSTKELANIISERFGKEPYVIPDPFELPERAAWHYISKGAPKLLWFGHPSNLASLTEIRHQIQEYPLRVVSSEVPGFWSQITPWSADTLQHVMAEDDIVIIPVPDTEKARCKSANRLIESIRSGLFVVANPSPSHDEFAPYAWIGDIEEGIRWAISNTEDVQRRIEAGQKYIRVKYSPQRIGDLWEQTLLPW